MTPRRPAADRLRRRGIAIAISCAFLMGVSMGITFPLLSIALEVRYGSGPIIGWNAAMAAISTVGIAPFAPALFARIPARTVLIGCSLAGAALFLLFLATDDLIAWFVLRFFFGAAGTLLFVGSEVWVNQLVRERRRGAMLGLYATAVAGGLGVGSALFALFGAQGPWGYVATSVAIGACALVLLPRAPRIRPPPPGEAGWRSFFGVARLAPIAVGGAFAFGAIETVMLNFTPVYAVRAGYGEAGAALFMAAAALGNIALQAPLGRLADAVGRARVLMFCAATGVVFPLLIIALPTGSHAWAVAGLIVVYAGVTVGMYAVGMALLASRFSASRMAQASAVYLSAYGLGALVSPPAAGVALERIDPNGPWWTLAAFAATFLAVAALARARPPALTERPRRG